MTTSLDLETVELKIEDRVAWIVLNRPEALNAWTRQLGEELIAALDHVAEDPDIRSLVITGAGRAFSSVADLKAGGGFGADGKPDVLTPLREVYNPLLLRVRTLPKPVIAAINGGAVGIGCSLALACDMLIASESAYFLLAYKGERLPAAKALEWGLVNEVVAPDQLGSTAGELAKRFAAGPPGSYADIKRMINARRLRRVRAAPGRRGRAPAGAGGVGRLHRGRDGVRPEAPCAIHRHLSRRLGTRGSG